MPSRRDLACAVLLGTVFIGLAAVELRNLYLRHLSEEALENLDILFMATTEYAALAHARGEPVLCPHIPGTDAGAAGPTPPLSVDCAAGPGGKCNPDGDSRPGSYAPALFETDVIWRALAYRKLEGHRYHFSFSARQYEDRCIFTISAQGDLDGDGEFSTFVRRGIATADGVRPQGPVELLDPYE